MSFLHDLVNLVHPQPVQQASINTGGHGPVQHAPVDPATVQRLNAQIAADGARMYQQAHPGKTYVPGQNGETYQGGIDQPTYQRLLTAPVQAKIPLRPMMQSHMLMHQTMQPRLQVEPYNPNGHAMQLQTLAMNNPQGLEPRHRGGAFNGVNPVDPDTLGYLQQVQPQRNALQRARGLR